MDEPLPARTLNEVRYYLMVTPCAVCGNGPYAADEIGDRREEPSVVVVEAHCEHCDAKRTFTATTEHEPPDDGVQAEIINPGAEPSRIVDLGQWLGLFYLLVESASSVDKPVETRRLGYRASLCLLEALKFYGLDDELPPTSAFFVPGTNEAYRNNPEKFARQKLRDMQGKLPSPAVMVANVSRDERTETKKWWQFWR